MAIAMLIVVVAAVVVLTGQSANQLVSQAYRRCALGRAFFRLALVAYHNSAVDARPAAMRLCG